MVADSQHLVGDPYVELALAAVATEHLQLGTAVTNLTTRDPPVTASSILTVHAESGGRAVLGVARADWALGFLGEPPMSLADHRVALTRLRAYLDGEVVERNGFPAAVTWPAGLGLPHLPPDVHAPVTRSSGWPPRWPIASPSPSVRSRPGSAGRSSRHARPRESAGLDPDDLQLGAFLMSAVADDPAEAARFRRRLGSRLALPPPIVRRLLRRMAHPLTALLSI